ncbi:MAG: hypothetical protein EOO25_04430 [Comamonadaceae bacterium]|nr:MAG: hypothetical protein EOO25_04430 [Comamonadaceae bacterium]
MGVLSRLLRSCLRQVKHRRGAVHAIKNIAICALLACTAGLFGFKTAAQASPVGLSALLPSAQPAGRARLRVWGFEVYDASLWVGPGFRQGDYASHPFALELAYLRDFRGSDITRRSIDEMARVGDFTPQQAQAWSAALAEAMPDVQKGDRLTGIHQPGRGALFLINGKPAGEVRDAQFSRLFFGIWLAPGTSEPRLRQALLAGVPP